MSAGENQPKKNELTIVEMNEILKKRETMIAASHKVNDSIDKVKDLVFDAIKISECKRLLQEAQDINSDLLDEIDFLADQNTCLRTMMNELAGGAGEVEQLLDKLLSESQLHVTEIRKVLQPILTRRVSDSA